MALKTFPMLPGMQLTTEKVEAVAAGYDGSKLHFFDLVHTSDWADWYWREYEPPTGQTGPHLDPSFNWVPFDVYAFGRPGTGQQGAVWTAQGWARGYPYLDAYGFPIDQWGRALQRTVSAQEVTTNIQAQKAGQLAPPSQPLVPMAAGADAAGMGLDGMGGNWKRWIPSAIQFLGDFYTIPSPPIPSANVDPNQALADDWDNQIAYSEALAKRGMITMLLDAVARGVDVALQNGRRLRTPPRDLKRWIGTAIEGISSLRSPPPRPMVAFVNVNPVTAFKAGQTVPGVVDNRQNVKNLVAYQASLANFAAMADLSATAAEVVDKLTL